MQSIETQQRARGFKRAPRAVGGIDLAGCRRSDHDCIYGDEWDRWAAEGIVRVEWAFSREVDQPRQNVQDHLRTHDKQIAVLLAAGAHVYVRGDGAHMAPAVRAAFAEISTGSAATPGLVLGPDRYHEDVWGGA